MADTPQGPMIVVKKADGTTMRVPASSLIKPKAPMATPAASAPTPPPLKTSVPAPTPAPVAQSAKPPAPIAMPKPEVKAEAPAAAMPPAPKPFLPPVKPEPKADAPNPIMDEGKATPAKPAHHAVHLKPTPQPAPAPAKEEKAEKDVVETKEEKKEEKRAVHHRAAHKVHEEKEEPEKQNQVVETIKEPAAVEEEKTDSKKESVKIEINKVEKEEAEEAPAPKHHRAPVHRAKKKADPDLHRSLLDEEAPPAAPSATTVQSSNRADQVTQVLQSLSFSVPEDLQNRLKSLVQLHLKDVRSTAQTKAAAKQPTTSGGLGLNDAQANELATKSEPGAHVTAAAPAKQEPEPSSDEPKHPVIHRAVHHRAPKPEPEAKKVEAPAPKPEPKPEPKAAPKPAAAAPQAMAKPPEPKPALVEPIKPAAQPSDAVKKRIEELSAKAAAAAAPLPKPPVPIIPPKPTVAPAPAAPAPKSPQPQPMPVHPVTSVESTAPAPSLAASKPLPSTARMAPSSMASAKPAPGPIAPKAIGAMMPSKSELPKMPSMTAPTSPQRSEPLFSLAPPSPIKKPMHDIAPHAVEMGPIEEIRYFTATDLRRLATAPTEALARFKQKFINLRDESILMFFDALAAWHDSPLYHDYIDELSNSLQEGRAPGAKGKGGTLSVEEIESLSNLERQLMAS